ncbi:MAG: PIN domain-containing protein [Blastocatellia bacterium]
MGCSAQLGQPRLQQLEAKFQEYTILPVEVETCRWWATVRVQCQNSGHPISSQDAWIAATALHYNLSLVTHNPDDFQHIAGLTVITQA